MSRTPAMSFYQLAIAPPPTKKVEQEPVEEKEPSAPLVSPPPVQEPHPLTDAGGLGSPSATEAEPQPIEVPAVRVAPVTEAEPQPIEVPAALVAPAHGIVSKLAAGAASVALISNATPVVLKAKDVVSGLTKEVVNYTLSSVQPGEAGPANVVNGTVTTAAAQAVRPISEYVTTVIMAFFYDLFLIVPTMIDNLRPVFAPVLESYCQYMSTIRTLPPALFYLTLYATVTFCIMSCVMVGYAMYRLWRSVIEPALSALVSFFDLVGRWTIKLYSATLSRFVFSPTAAVIAWYKERRYRKRPVDVKEAVVQESEGKTVDLRALPFVYELKGDQSWFKAVTLEGGVKTQYLFPAKRGLSLSDSRPLDDGRLLTQEKATIQGRTRVLAHAPVPDFLVTFFDKTEGRVLGNGGRVNLPKRCAAEPQIITNAHVVRLMETNLKAGHEILMRKLGGSKGVPVCRERVGDKQHIALDTCVLGVNLDLARIVCPGGVASSLGIRAADISDRATPTPEFWYETSAVYITPSDRVTGTTIPYNIEHSGSTEAGASGCLGLKRRGNKISVSYLHWAGDNHRPNVNHAINLTELYCRRPLPPKPEGGDDYSDDEREPRTHVDPEFDLQSIKRLYWDYNGDQAIGYDSQGRAGWVTGVQVLDGKLVLSFDNDQDEKIGSKAWDLADQDDYYPLGEMNQGDFDRKAFAAFAGLPYFGLKANPKAPGYVGPMTESESARPKTDDDILLESLHKEKKDAGRKLAAIAQAMHEEKEARKEMEARFNSQSQTHAAAMQLAVEQNKALAEKVLALQHSIAATASAQQADREAQLAAIRSAEERKPLPAPPTIEVPLVAPSPRVTPEAAKGLTVARLLEEASLVKPQANLPSSTNSGAKAKAAPAQPAKEKPPAKQRLREAIEQKKNNRGGPNLSVKILQQKRKADRAFEQYNALLSEQKIRELTQQALDVPAPLKGPVQEASATSAQDFQLPPPLTHQ